MGSTYKDKKSGPPPNVYRSDPSKAGWREDIDWMSSVYCDAVSNEIQQTEARDLRHVDPHKKWEISEMLEKILLRGSLGCLLIAEKEGQRVGYFLGMVKDCVAEIPSRIGYVNGLYVIGPYRRQGIGQRLLNEGNEWFRNVGLELVELYTASGNAEAKGFWRKNGFFQTEVVMLCPI